MFDAIMTVLLIIAGVVIIFFCGVGHERSNTVDYIMSPYCEKVTIGGESLEKCWKLIEIKTNETKEK